MIKTMLKDPIAVVHLLKETNGKSDQSTLINAKKKYNHIQGFFVNISPQLSLRRSRMTTLAAKRKRSEALSTGLPCIYPDRESTFGVPIFSH
jgi:hypothetical protein